MGFCMGVRRAMEIALAAEGERVLALGPLIHNGSALAELARRGVGFIAEEELRGAQLRGATVVVRAHGISPSARAALAATGAKVVDATCPTVLASQRRAREAYEKGLRVFIAGDRGHGEVRGIAGHAPGATILSAAAEAAAVPVGGEGLLIAQTTFGEAEYERIAGALRARGIALEVLASICGATRRHREALVGLAEAGVEGIVVVGGAESANARRLHEAALATGKPAWFVEGPDGLDSAEGLNGRGFVGLTASASTPDWEIDAVEKALLAM